jgi:hypothetical protein
MQTGGRGVAGEEGRTRVVPARLTAFGAPSTRALVTVADVSPGARLRRGVMGLAACWGGAAVAVFLPILHFVLVPGLLGAGIAAAIVLGRQAQRVTDVRGTCPRCLAEERFQVGGRVRPTRLTACPRCHGNVTLLLDDGAAGEAAMGVGTRA